MLTSCASDGPEAPTADDLFGPGVSLALAQSRADVYSDIRYELELRLPAQPAEPITGHLIIRFELQRVDGPLVLDFVEAAERLEDVRVGGKLISAVAAREHILIPEESLQSGANAIELQFQAGDLPLNRRDDYLYALLVPDRARETFPCFDQPDLKARYRLLLDLPATWQAISNSAEESRVDGGDRSRILFGWTKPISTYLFTFAAGVFEIEEAVVDGRRFRFFHRETDTGKVERNRDAIFELHAAALEWLEDYTALQYPFSKFEFVLLPAFQYGGMEHPGSIFYRDSSLFLGPSPTQGELLRRASLISHETAHMWFGDLVTMRWFNDVWTKEVFASFMAAKIVAPSFPEVDHRLRFLLAHHPAAYDVDRSQGTHPIRQQLENLNDAGSLYGAMIYQKAPILMKQMERLIGEEALREGLRNYLADFSFGNATWPELIAMLDDNSALDLTSWSRRWVEEAGRPRVTTQVTRQETGWVVELIQSDPLGQDRTWMQEVETVIFGGDRRQQIPLRLEGVRTPVGSFQLPPLVLADASGSGYGEFEMNNATRAVLPRLLVGDQLPAVVRAFGWMSLWEDVLAQRLEPTVLLGAILEALPAEADELILQNLLGRVQTLYWRFLSADERRTLAEHVEKTLWDEVLERAGTSVQKAFFRSWQSVVVTREGTRRLLKIWQGMETVSQLEFDRPDFTGMVVALAVRSYSGIVDVIDRELQHIKNPERRRRLEFLRPALSSSPVAREAFFETLRDPQQRRREPWVLSALSAIHHPLRAGESLALIDPALEMLLDVKETGDIFFPKRWADAVLGGHRSAEAAAIVRAFLDRHPHYPPRLKGKLLQSADLLFRASRISVEG